MSVQTDVRIKTGFTGIDGHNLDQTGARKHIQRVIYCGFGQVISVGIGTSMLQFKNILKKPILWLPTIITSAILGPISTMVFKMECNSVGAGMGTCGLVGQMGTIASMSDNQMMCYVGIVLLHFVLPAILVFVIDLIFRKAKLIKPGDLTI